MENQTFKNLRGLKTKIREIEKKCREQWTLSVLDQLNVNIRGMSKREKFETLERNEIEIIRDDKENIYKIVASGKVISSLSKDFTMKFSKNATFLDFEVINIVK